MTRTRVRALLAVCAAASAGCGLLFDFGDYDGARPDLSSEGGVTVDGAPVPPRSFVLSVEPTSIKGTSGDRVPVVVRVTRGELFSEEVALSIAPGQDVVVEAPVIASSAREANAIVIPGNTHGVRNITIVGTSPLGATSSTSLRVDVRGRPGSLDTSFANGGVLEQADILQGVDVVTVEDDRIVVGTNLAGGGITRDALTLARFTEGGALDPTFGTGGRAQVVPANGGNGDGTQCVARGPAPGSVLVAGTSGTKRFLLLGAADDKGKPITSFGEDSTGVVSLGQANCRSLSALPGGAIVIAASTFLQRRTSNGASDPAWGDAGEIPFTGIGEELWGALADDAGAMRAYGTFTSWPIGADGTRGAARPHAPKTTGGCTKGARPAHANDGLAVVGGTCGGLIAGGGEDKPVLGLLADGVPSEKFGESGFAVGPGSGYTAAVVGLPGGVVRVSGTSKPDRLGVTMYDATAGVRWLFDGATVPSLADARASAATVDSKGRVVVVGAREVGGTTRLFLIRLWT